MDKPVSLVAFQAVFPLANFLTSEFMIDFRGDDRLLASAASKRELNFEAQAAHSCAVFFTA